MKLLKLVTITLLLCSLVVGCSQVNQVELKNWATSFKKFNKSCQFPIGVRAGDKRLLKNFRLRSASIEFWNKIGRELGSKQSFFSREYQSSGRNVYIYSIRTSDDCAISSDTFGSTSYEVKGKLAKTNLCIHKYKEITSLINSSRAYGLKLLGLHGILNHELGHLLGGPKHPKKYGDLMSEKPVSNNLSYHYKRIIRRHVIERCQLHK